MEEVELEPNVGFDVDDELIGPAHICSPRRPAVAPTADAPRPDAAVVDPAPQAGCSKTSRRRRLRSDAAGRAIAEPAAEPEPIEAPVADARSPPAK